MLRMFSVGAIMTLASAAQSVGALHAQSAERLPVKPSTQSIAQDPAHDTWIDRYTSMLGLTADQKRIPASQPEVLAKFKELRRSLEATRVRTMASAASQRPECPMPIAKLDSSRVAEMRVSQMRVLPRDSGQSSMWTPEGRVIGCTNPLARESR